MNKITMVRYTTTSDAADENQRLVEDVFEELASTDPGGVHYATFRLEDGVTFVHIAAFDADANPLAETSAFARFQSGIADRCAGPPELTPVTVVGSYRFVGA